jgi:invasion protein IalB
MTSMNRLRSLCLAAALAACGSSALAQDDGGAQQQQQARKPITPTTMKTFSGWDVRCYPVQAPVPCDMWEAIAFKKGGQLAVSVSIVYVPSRDIHLLQLVVPPGVDFAQGAKIVTASYSSEAWKYHHCDRIGCYVIVQDGNPVVEALKSQPDMKVRVVQFRGKSIDLNVPLKGFNDAHNMLVELAKQKSTSAEKVPAAQVPAPSTDSNP